VNDIIVLGDKQIIKVITGIRKYYKTYAGKTDDSEVDFVITKSDETKYIQVALSVRDKNKLERELALLNAIRDRFINGKRRYLIK